MRNQVQELTFAAFVMTYERPTILIETINTILNQTFPPEKILVVDNSETSTTQERILNWNHPKIEYHRMGYNTGPAGAARVGLERLTAEGYQWIFWGDDDDPPSFEDSFEILFQLVDSLPQLRIGIVGAVGQYFDSLTGTIQRVPNEHLIDKTWLKVNSIAGGQTMIVNSQVVKQGTLPSEELYFGFEELDFCLRVEKMNYGLVVSTDLFNRARKKFNRITFKRAAYHVQDYSRLYRQYYSTRNLMVILRRSSLYLALIYQLLKSAGKSIYGFRFGWQYGVKNFCYIWLGIFHAASNKLGLLKFSL